MALRLPSIVFLASMLTLSCLSCAKKDDPQPPASSASYILDGKARTCQASYSTSSGAGYDFLSITLTTTPQPSNGAETLYLSLRRPVGQTSASYEYIPVGSMLVYNAKNTQPLDFQHFSPPLTLGSSGYSGTFSGEMRAYVSVGTYTVLHTITAGTFANVQP